MRKFGVTEEIFYEPRDEEGQIITSSSEPSGSNSYDPLQGGMSYTNQSHIPEEYRINEDWLSNESVAEYKEEHSNLFSTSNNYLPNTSSVVNTVKEGFQDILPQGFLKPEEGINWAGVGLFTGTALLTFFTLKSTIQ